MSPPDSKRLESTVAFDLLSTSAKLLFANGQTTERMIAAVQQFAARLGYRITVFSRWGELAFRIEDGAGWRHEIVAVDPAGVDMSKVVATMGLIDEVCAGRTEASAAGKALEKIAKLPPVSLLRFALMAAAGAAALGVIFGTSHLLGLVLIAFVAGTGACLRRWLAGKSHNLFIQPFCAALLAGIIGAIVIRLQVSSASLLVAVCPCMVLVPGPHFLNATIDLARARIVLGAARLAYALLITLMICTGLLLGLAVGGVDLPPSGPSSPAPFLYDVMSAGVAVAAYGSFFAMPWRMLPIPILIGMFAHALRWVALSMGASMEIGALVACLLVGAVTAPIADRLRLPFAGLAFASVVSLIPGVFLFRMAGGMVDLVTLGARATPELVTQIAADGTTALMIVLAMAFGLIFPRICIDWH